MQSVYDSYPRYYNLDIRVLDTFRQCHTSRTNNKICCQGMPVTVVSVERGCDWSGDTHSMPVWSVCGPVTISASCHLSAEGDHSQAAPRVELGD